jgi:TetR/AcrR family transcriptional repressor of bet genes
MKLNAVQRARRANLQKAAYEIARKRGFHSLTIDQVARQAGTSKGTVHNYFRNKTQLIEYAVRYSHLVYRNAIVSRLKQAKTPSERLWSIIDGTFDRKQFGPETCRLWLTIYDQMRYDKKLARLVSILDQRSISLTLSTIRELVDPDEVNDKAYAIMALMDGFWLLSATDPAITRKAALLHIAGYLRKNLPRFDPRAITL